LIYRFVIVNVGLIALVAALALHGLIEPVFANDQSYISFGIAGLFVIGWIWVAKEILVASCDMNGSEENGPQSAAIPDADKDLGKIAWLDDVAEYLVRLGLIGTLVGFVIALSGIDSGSIASATGAQAAVASLMAGMATAIGTTLLGASLALWHSINMRMLQTALNTYWCNRLLVPPDEVRD
jgi:hypothetical protein